LKKACNGSGVFLDTFLSLRIKKYLGCRARPAISNTHQTDCFAQLIDSWVQADLMVGQCAGV
jgi:hypothetical protein